jgi:hypothetical protein
VYLYRATGFSGCNLISQFHERNGRRFDVELDSAKRAGTNLRSRAWRMRTDGELRLGVSSNPFVIAVAATFFKFSNRYFGKQDKKMLFTLWTAGSCDMETRSNLEVE